MSEPDDAGRGAEPGAGATPWTPTTGAGDGRGRRPARRGVPGHRRPACRRSATPGSSTRPLSESGIIGTAIGLAMRGYRPVCEIQFDGFVFPAFDQITTQLAKYHARSDGPVRLPVTIRIPYGGGIGAVEHHSESPEAYFTHTAGLRIVTCSHARDGYQMLRQAITCDDPVIFLEPKRRYWDKAEMGEVSEGLFQCAGGARRHATSTLVCYGPMVRTCLEAAGLADEEDGISPGSHRPAQPVAAGPRTRSSTPCAAPAACVIVHEAPVFGGLGRGDRRADQRGVLLQSGGTRAAGRGATRALPAVETGAPLPARCGPDPGCRRHREGDVMQTFQMPDVGEGLTEAEIVRWFVEPGEQVERQPDPVRDRDRQGAGGTAQPLRGNRRRTARPGR